MKGSKEAYDEALERWSRYERECLLANTAHMTLTPPSEPPTHYPNIIYPREKLMEFRAAYVLLRNALAELLDLDPDTMTQGDVFLAMLKRNMDARRALDDETDD